MGPAPICGIYHQPRKIEFTENWRHESQTSKPRNSASRYFKINGKLKQNTLNFMPLKGFVLKKEGNLNRE